MYDPTKTEVEQQLRKTESLITEIGDTVAGHIDTQTADGRPAVGRNVQHGALGYRILGIPGESYLKVEAGFDAAEVLVAESTAAAATDGGSQVISPMSKDEATSEIRDALDEEDIPEVRVDLSERLVSPGVAASYNTDGELVTGFTVNKLIWPFEGDVAVSEFYDSVQTVVSLTWSAKQLLVHEYGLRDLLDGSGPSSVRGIQ
jgi:hypothetical protein